MKTTIKILPLLFLLASCAITENSPNTLNEPGYVEPTAPELHRKNIRIISSNPGFELWEEFNK